LLKIIFPEAIRFWNARREASGTGLAWTPIFKNIKFFLIVSDCQHFIYFENIKTLKSVGFSKRSVGFSLLTGAIETKKAAFRDSPF